MKRRLGYVAVILVVVAVVWFRALQQERLAGRPPVVERTVAGSTAGITPAPDFLLRHCAELGLTAGQHQQIEKVSVAYEKELAGLRKRADAAAAEFGRYLQAKSGRPRESDLQRQSTDYRHLSSVMTTTRQSYWRQATSTLTARQQQLLPGLLKGVSLADITNTKRSTNEKSTDLSDPGCPYLGGSAAGQPAGSRGHQDDCCGDGLSLSGLPGHAGPGPGKAAGCEAGAGHPGPCPGGGHAG